MARTARLALEIDGRGAKRGASEADRELRNLKNSARQTTDELRKLGSGAEAAGRGANRARDGLRGARGEADRASGSFLRARVSADGLATSFVALRNAAIVVLGLQLGKMFLDVTDKSKMLEAQLRLAIPATTSLARAQQDAERIARETRIGIEATVDLYAKTSRQAAEMGKSQDSAARATETFAKTLKISGAAQSEAASVSRQFGQALASGVLRGDEFNSVMENSPRLARLLADSLGKPVGTLRTMAEQGELTADKLYAALTDRKFTDKIDAEFKLLPVTFGEAVTLVKDTAIDVFGAFDRGGQFSNAVVNFVTGGVDGMDDMRDSAEELGIEISSIAAGIMNAFSGEGASFSFFDIVAGEVEGLRKLFDDLLGAIDATRNAVPAFANRIRQNGRNAGIGFLFGEDTALPSNLQQDYRQGMIRQDRRLSLDQSDRNFYNNMPTGWDFRAPGAAARWMRGETTPRGGTAPAETGGSTTQTRTREQVLADFKSELSKRGVVTISDIRSAADQNRLHRQGLTPLDGYIRPSRHQNAQAVDFQRSTFNEAKVREAAAAAGLKGLEIVTESGGRKHAEWSGAGKAGDLSDQLAEQERIQDQLIKQAEERAKKEAGFWTTLKGEAATAALLPIAAAQYNAEAKLKAILNENNLGVERELTAEQKLQIANELQRKRDGEFQLAVAQQQLEQESDLRRLEAEGAALRAGSAEAEEDQLRIALAGLKVKEEALAKGKSLTDATVIAAVAEAEARERANASLARKNELIRKGNALVDELNDARLTPEQRLTRDFQRNRDAVLNSTRPQAQKDAALEELTKQFAADMNAARDQFFSEVQRNIDDVGEALGGAFGKAVQSAMTLANIFAQMMESTYQAGTVGARAGNPVSKALTGIKGIADTIKGGLTDPNGPLGKTLGKLSTYLGQAADGAATGAQVAGIAKSLGWKKFSSTGAQIGGAAGQVIGTAVGGPIGGMIGSVVGSVAGGGIGSIFKKSKKPSATAVIQDFGDPRLSSQDGGDKGAASQGAGDVISGLRSLIDTLGGTLGAFDVSIGQYKGQWRVSPHGSSGPLNFKGGSARGLRDFNDDYESAVKFAILDAIRDGAIQGLGPTIEKVLKSATEKNFDSKVSDAALLASIPKTLKQMDNPIGASIETLNAEFTKVKKLLDQYGGTAQEYADAERLYQKKRLEIIEEGNNGALRAMRAYLFELQGGQSSVLAPQLRYNAAKAELDRLDAMRAGGGNVDFDKYQSAADAFLSASRDYQGSNLNYFGDLKRITDTLGAWVAKETAGVGTLPTVDFSPVTAVLTTHTTIFQQMLAAMQNGGAGTTSTKFGDMLFGAMFDTLESRYVTNA